MFERIARSIELVKTSWKILIDDKKLLAFLLLSGLALLFVIISFIIPIILTGQAANLTTKGSPLTLALLFIFYLVSYFVVIFFNIGLITCVNARLQGRDATIGDSLVNAARHIGKILAWALVSATVGLILQAIEDRAGFAGQIASAIVGGVWSLVAFFVVPILVLEERRVADSLGSHTLSSKRPGARV